MMLIFELRAKITGIYQKYAFWFNLAARFLLCYVAFSRIRGALNYNPTLGKNVVILALAAICSVIPSTLMVLIAAVYVTLQIYAASGSSLIMAITVFALFMVCYCFFIRFTPRYGAAVVATPILQNIGFPYAMPLFLGVFATPVSIVPVCCGIFAYNTIHYVKNNIAEATKVTTEAAKEALEDPQGVYMKVLKELVANPAMYVTMLVMAVVIVAVYFVRRIRMDYAFEISIAVGTGLMMLGYIIGDLKYDMGIRVGSMVLSCLICAGIVIFMLFFYRTLQYSAAELVEFEDEDYYYYVKAVPKIKVGAPKRREKRVIRRRRTGDDDDEEEYEDAALGMIDYGEKDPGGSPILRKKREAVEIDEDDEDDEDDEFGDDFSLEDAKPASRYGTRVGKRDEAAPAAAASKPGPKAKPAAGLFEDDEDDDDDDEVIVAPAGRNGTTAAAEPYPEDDDDDDDDEERVIRGYFSQENVPDGEDDSVERDDDDEDYL
jgi:hypothetical protein